MVDVEDGDSFTAMPAAASADVPAETGPKAFAVGEISTEKSGNSNVEKAPLEKNGGKDNSGDGNGQVKENKEGKEKKGAVGICTLFFKYATATDIALMLLGTVAAIVTG